MHPIPLDEAHCAHSFLEPQMNKCRLQCKPLDDQHEDLHQMGMGTCREHMTLVA